MCRSLLSMEVNMEVAWQKICLKYSFASNIHGTSVEAGRVGRFEARVSNHFLKVFRKFFDNVLEFSPGFFPDSVKLFRRPPKE